MVQVVGSRHPHNTVKAVFQALSEVGEIFLHFFVSRDCAIICFDLSDLKSFCGLNLDSAQFGHYELPCYPYCKEVFFTKRHDSNFFSLIRLKLRRRRQNEKGVNELHTMPSPAIQAFGVLHIPLDCTRPLEFCTYHWIARGFWSNFLICDLRQQLQTQSQPMIRVLS